MSASDAQIQELTLRLASAQNEAETSRQRSQVLEKELLEWFDVAAEKDHHIADLEGKNAELRQRVWELNHRKADVTPNKLDRALATAKELQLQQLTDTHNDLLQFVAQCDLEISVLRDAVSGAVSGGLDHLDAQIKDACVKRGWRYIDYRAGH